MIVDQPGYCQVGFYVAKSGTLQCAVRRNVEGIWFGKKSLQVQGCEINGNAPPDTFDAEALRSVIGRDDMKMHVGLIAVEYLVCGGEAERFPVCEP